ncbi:hypothetical protein BU16DRAFT_619016 [Lophium mytilinum]|uniref:Hydrophobin 3 n=1 Tax=Lophium mytilinum TaxID=390894 RepID=A0A6A6QP66_9PEZI|nr:hypothetical protein BU16DRAFT_619016 [Lophium mytilinum]
MKPSTVFSILSLALATSAAPNDGGSCNGGNNKQVCCTGVLNCVVQVLGSNCDASTYCCSTDATTGAIISINALNCVKL